MSFLFFFTKVILCDNLLLKGGVKYIRVRIFYFTYVNNKFILLHGFIKKTMTTPKNEINKALKYMQDYKRRAENE